jgi:cell wall-associated NlpC family hydrolase
MGLLPFRDDDRVLLRTATRLRPKTWWLGAALAVSMLLLIPIAQTAPGPAGGFSAFPAPGGDVSPPALGKELVVTENGEAGTTEVSNSAGEWLATFTLGARTVAVAGPERTFDEDTAAAPVVTSTYVRLLPEPFAGGVDEEWLRRTAADTSPDLLAVAGQYVDGAPDHFDAAGLRVSGDAHYGPISEDGRLRKGADFNDYLGLPWDYRDEADQPEADELGALDCSGFVRMVFGYRGGLPMTRDPADGLLPRRSFEMLDDAPGNIIYQSDGRLKEFDGIQAGDLVFFDAQPDDDDQIDHVGVFLGVDTEGNHRFISSRKTADGPTMGDDGGRSILDGGGYYAKAFRAVRRL